MRTELTDHGIESEQYFQGCGVSCTPYDHAVTGIGHNLADAFDDCLGQIASGWDSDLADKIEQQILADEGLTEMPATGVTCYECDCPTSCDGCELHHYASIRWTRIVAVPRIPLDIPKR